MPDMERPLRSLELHMCKTAEDRAYVLGYLVGLDKARKEVLWVVAINALAWIAFGFMLHGG